MNLPRRTFLSRILAGAVAAPALTRIIEGSTKPREVPPTEMKFKFVDKGEWVYTDDVIPSDGTLWVWSRNDYGHLGERR